MSAELRAALTEAFEKETPSNEPQNTSVETESAFSTESQEEVSSTEQGHDEVSRSEDSRKAIKEQDAAGKKVADTTTGKESVQNQGKNPPGEKPVGEHRIDRAPASWKKEAKGEWAALPLQARQEIHRREMEVQRVLNEAAPLRQEMQQFRETVTPYMARIQSLGVTPHQAISTLLNADYKLATGTSQQKAQFIDKLLQDYGVDINELDSVIAKRLGVGGQSQQPQSQFDPNQVTQLVQQQLQQALAPLYQQQQQAQQQVAQQAEMTVEQMSLDPKFPHFEDARQDMADIMELNSRRGVYISVQEAYNRAISMNPELSAMQQAAQLNQRARQAASAAASVSGSPVGGGNQVHISSGSLRDDLEAAFGGNRI